MMGDTLGSMYLPTMNCTATSSRGLSVDTDVSLDKRGDGNESVNVYENMYGYRYGVMDEIFLTSTVSVNVLIGVVRHGHKSSLKSH